MPIKIHQIMALFIQDINDVSRSETTLDRQGPTQEEIDQVPYRMLWGALGREFQWLMGIRNQKVGPTVDGRKKSCTSWYGRYPIIYKFLYIPSGAGFLPSTVFILKTYSTVVVAWIRFTKLLFLAVQKLTTIGQWSPKNDQLEYQGHISFMVMFQSVKLLIIWAAEKRVNLVGDKNDPCL